MVQSIATGAVYIVDQATSAFYRTIHPASRRLTRSSPREVIKEDRRWLFPLLAGEIPGGRTVLELYRMREREPAHAETRRRQARELEEDVDHEGPPSKNGTTLGISVREQRTVIVETTRTIDLAPHQIHALLRLAGQVVPNDARIEQTTEGYVRVAWTETTEEQESRKS